MKRRPLPPFGHEYLEKLPITGTTVAIGPGAWEFAKRQPFVCMVLPEASDPPDFEWPTDGQTALIHERGERNDARLRSMAEALLLSGATSIVAIREALLDDYDPRVFFDAEVIDVAT